MSDMTLSAEIVADVSGFTSGVSKAEGALSGFKGKCESAASGASGLGDDLDSAGSGASSFKSKCDGAAISASGFGDKLTTLRVAAGNLVADLAGRAIQAIGDLAGEMVAASDSADKFRSTLEFAGLDTGTIDELTKSTQAYADQTVYDLADIRNATAQLAANGVDNYAQLAEAAGNLNAVAGGNADTFKSVSMVMSQTAGSGKLMTENWNQLTDAIPGASGALQDAMRSAGAFEGNFREAMESGEISADEFFAAVHQLGMTDVAREAATSTSTIEGAVGNLQASVVGVGSQVVDAVKPMVTGAMTELSSFISSIPSMLSGVAAYFQPLTDALVALGGAFAPVVAQVQTQLWPALQNLAATLAPLVEIVSQVAAIIVSTVGPVLADIISKVVSVVSSIAEGLVPAVQNVAAIIQEVLPVIQAVWSSVWGAVQGVIDAVWPVIESVVTTVMDVVNGVIETVLAVISGDWKGAWEAIQGVADAVWEGIGSIIDTATQAIADVINSVVTGIQNVWNDIWGAIGDYLSRVWDNIGDVVTGAVDAVSGAIDAALSWIQDAWNSAWDAVSSFLSDCWEGITDTLSDAIDGVIQFFADLPGNILDAIGNVGNLLWDAGASIIDGLLGGLKSAAEGMFSWVGGIADTIASLKGPLPYDRRLLIPAGNAIMEGLLGGLTEGFREVRSEVSGMAAAISGEVASGVSVPMRFDASGTAASLVASPAAAYVGSGVSAATSGGSHRYVVNIDGASISADGRMASMIEELVSYAVRQSKAI